jgi:hypothetical protein
VTLSRAISHGDRCRRECLNFKPARVVWAFCIVGCEMGAVVEQSSDQETGRLALKVERTNVNRAMHQFGGEQAVVAALTAGSTLLQIGRQIGLSPDSIYEWVERTPERAALISRARARGAAALVEDGMSMLDQATTREEVQIAEARAKYRQWVASRVDRDTWGDTPAVQLTINTNEMHLEALRNRSKP